MIEVQPHVVTCATVVILALIWSASEWNRSRWSKAKSREFGKAVQQIVSGLLPLVAVMLEERRARSGWEPLVPQAPRPPLSPPVPVPDQSLNSMVRLLCFVVDSRASGDTPELTAERVGSMFGSLELDLIRSATIQELSYQLDAIKSTVQLSPETRGKIASLSVLLGVPEDVAWVESVIANLARKPTEPPAS